MYTRALDILPAALLLALLGTAVYTDLRSGKIYNALTLPCIVLGIVLNTLSHGFQGLLSSLGGAGLILVLFLIANPPAAGIGRGDTKLMMAVGAITGFTFTIWALLLSAISGGLLALVVMLRHRILLSTARNMAGNVYLGAVTRTPVGLSNGSKGVRFRYSPAIALGTLSALLLGLGR